MTTQAKPLVVLAPYTNRNAFPLGIKRPDGAFDVIGEINGQGGAEANNKLRAESFVRAVNNHDALLEALQAMLRADDAICENIGHKSDQAMQRIAAIDIARAAIQSATINQ